MTDNPRFVRKYYKCCECGKVCDIYTREWKEREEAWGAPCYRTEYEDLSECCNAEVDEITPAEAELLEE